MCDGIFKALAVVLGSLAVILGESTTCAAITAPSLATLDGNNLHNSQATMVGDLGWHEPGWGPAPSPGWCGGPPCGAGAGWQTSGWGPVPSPGWCGGPPCGLRPGWQTSGWGPVPSPGWCGG